MQYLNSYPQSVTVQSNIDTIFYKDHFHYQCFNVTIQPVLLLTVFFTWCFQQSMYIFNPHTHFFFH